MKKILLLIITFFTVPSFAQQAITNFLGGANMSFDSLVTTDLPSQSGIGGPQTWFYSNASNGSVIETVEAPTSQELIDFPTATHVFRTVGTIDGQPTNGVVFVNISGSTVSVVGLIIDSLTLKYDTGSALVGTYPLAYGTDNFDDTVSGTFIYQQYTGTFSGVLSTKVNAYGVLEDNLFASIPVTRLSSIQDLDLSYLNLGVVGNLTVTSESFYTDSGTPEFAILRQATTSLNVPLLSINETRTRVEYASQFASTDFEPTVQNRLSLAQNPVEDLLEIVTDVNVISVEVFDMRGKLYGSYPTTTIDVNTLSTGVYIAVVKSVYGTKSIKFVKN